MSRSVTVASGRTPMGAEGSIHWAITSQEPALHLFRRSEQNRMIRIALRLAGRAWIKTFLPMRFTKYVERRPFSYGNKNVGFYINKARRMGLLKEIVLDPYLNGWDPWRPGKPPDNLVRGFKRQNPAKYRFSVTGAFSGLYSDMRAWGKKLVRNVVAKHVDQFHPFVQSGELRSDAKRARARSIATAGKAQVRIAIPGPWNERNSSVSDTIRTVPRWEVAFIARQTKAALVRALNGRGVTAPTRDATGAQPGRAA